MCGRACKTNQRALCCDDCDKWAHKDCVGITSSMYVALGDSSDPWFCPTCNSRNASTVIYSLPIDNLQHSYRSSTNSKKDASIFSDSLETTIPSTSDENNNQSTSSDYTSIPSPSGIENTHPTMASSPKPQQSQKDKPPVKQLRILNINFRSIKKKGKQLEAIIDTTKPDIIIGTETWLDSNIHSSEIIPNYLGFNVHRRDRKGASYGGILIAAKNDLEIENVKSAKDLEFLSGSIKLSKKKSLHLAAFYRPPSDTCETYLQTVKQEFDQFRAHVKKDSIIVVGGDFNLPDINWTNNSIEGNQYPKNTNSAFLDIVVDLGLEQQVDFPTRVDPKTKKENILDIILTSHPSLRVRCKPLSAVGLSDHDIVLYDTSINPYRAKPQRRKIFLWNKANTEEIRNDVKTFAYKFKDSNFQSVCAMWDYFKSSIQAIIDQRVPSKLTPARFTNPWINTEIRRAIRRKQRAHTKCRRSKKKKDIDRYKKLQKEVKFMIRIANKKYIENTVDEAYTSNSKRFWSYVKSKGQESSGVPPLKSKDGYLKSDSKTKAEILNEQFESVFTKEDLTNQPDKGHSPFTPMENITVDPIGIKKLLQNLKTFKATGPDAIPAFILKISAEEISPVLSIIFQKSLDTGVVPDDWKNAWIVPIYKKGEKHLASNYRPVSLTSITCKVLEHIVHTNIMQHFDSHNILTNSQHGFRRRRSCETQLVITTHEIARNIAEGAQVDVILLDFSKAFDKVPHKRLLHKLSYYGVQDNTLNWIKSFLEDRKQEVLLEGIHSSPANVTSGVPQGTVLGPLLFLTYINDLPDVVQHSKTKLFADDCLLFKAIHNANDQRLLQSDLSALEQWEIDWQMDFNPSKCTVIQIVNRSTSDTSYILHGETLQTVTDSKYLGITFNNKLTWQNHINATTTKANNVLGFVRRNLHDCSLKVKSAAYTTMVRPILEYSATVWDPHLQKEINQLESVQRRAARFVTNNYYNREPGCVTNMLKQLKWDSLQERRQNLRLGFLHKINNNLVDVNINSYVKRSDSRTRGNQRFHQEHTKNQILYNSFFPRTVRDWNKLPPKITSIQDPEVFRAHLGGNNINRPAHLTD